MPERWKRVGEKSEAGNRAVFLFDKSLNEVVEHRMNRKQRIGILRIQKLSDKFARLRIENSSFVGAAMIDQPEVAVHRLRTSRQKGLVKLPHRSVDRARLLQRLSDRNFQSCFGCRQFQGRRGTVVSFPGVGG